MVIIYERQTKRWTKRWTGGQKKGARETIEYILVKKITVRLHRHLLPRLKISSIIFYKLTNTEVTTYSFLLSANRAY